MLKRYVDLGALSCECAANCPQAFRDNGQYRLEQPPTADSFNRQLFGQHRQIPAYRPRSSPSQRWSPPSRITNDACSIFIGNLPSDISQEQLCRLFDMHGPIQNVEIIHAPATRSKSCTSLRVLAI